MVAREGLGDGVSCPFSSLPSPCFTLLKCCAGIEGTFMQILGTSLSLQSS